jgi:capsid portal protein
LFKSLKVLDYLSKIEQKILTRKLFAKKLNLFFINFQKIKENRLKIKPIFIDFAKKYKKEQ